MSRLYRGTRGGRVYVVVDEGLPQPLHPRNDVRNHSPTGFAWGYSGSGPAQLALAIMCDLLPTEREKAQMAYQAFKRDVVAGLSQERDWELSDLEVLNWLRTWESECFDVAWEYLQDCEAAGPAGGEQYGAVRAAWDRAGRPVSSDLFATLLVMLMSARHTLII